MEGYGIVKDTIPLHQSLSRALSAYPKNRPFDTRCPLLRKRFFGILRYTVCYRPSRRR